MFTYLNNNTVALYILPLCLYENFFMKNVRFGLSDSDDDDDDCWWRRRYDMHMSILAMYWYFGIHNKFQNKTFIYWIHLQKRLLNELLGNVFIGFSQIMNSDEWIIHESFYFVLNPGNGIKPKEGIELQANILLSLTIDYRYASSENLNLVYLSVP